MDKWGLTRTIRMSGARPQRDAIGARGRLQGHERVMRIDVGQVGHASLFDQIAQAGQQFEQARDDLVDCQPVK